MDMRRLIRQAQRRLIVTSVICSVTAGYASLTPEAYAQDGQANSSRQLAAGLSASFNGMQEFTEDGTWTAPGRDSGRRAGHVLVLLCGAGGGGSGARVRDSDEDSLGAPGGSGAAVLTTIPVAAGQTYSVTIGVGGAGGVGLRDIGQPGSATTFDGSDGQVLAQAGAGGGGAVDEAGARIRGVRGEGQAHAHGGIVRPGPTAHRSIDELCLTFAPDDIGVGGQGGEDSPSGQLVPGQPGRNGWALVIW